MLISRLPKTTLVAVLCGAVSVNGGEPSTRKTAVTTTTSTEFQSTRHFVERHVVGNLTLEHAVNLALRQNPQVLRAIEEIERTRGQIIEVRAAALPHITLSGIYEQQDRRLLRGGGQGASGATAGNSTLGTVSSISNATTGSTTATGGTTQNVINASNGTTVRHATAATVGSTGTDVTSGNASSGSSSVSNNEDLVKELSALFSQGSAGGGDFIQNKSWNIRIEARQTIYAGGQIRAALRIAQLANDSAYFSLRDVIDTVISITRQQFYNVLLTRALILVQEESVRLLEQQLQDQQNRFEAGTVPRFNVLQAEVALANARPNLIRARNNYLISQAQLSKTLNLDPGPDGKPSFNCVGVLNAATRQISLPDSLALARARRPFLKVQRQAILIDVENIVVEKAGYKPRLDASAGYEFRNRAGSDELSDVVNGWFFGVTGSWDIFDGFATYGRVKQARARLEQSKVNYDDSVHQVDLEVETAYFNLAQARETIVSQQKNIEQALEAVRLAQERLAAGAGTQLDVLNAQVQLTLARSTELQARADYNNALADYDRATATNTVYHEDFKDPLDKTQKGIFARIAETGLPKSGEKSGKH